MFYEIITSFSEKSDRTHPLPLAVWKPPLTLEVTTSWGYRGVRGEENVGAPSRAPKLPKTEAEAWEFQPSD